MKFIRFMASIGVGLGAITAHHNAFMLGLFDASDYQFGVWKLLVGVVIITIGVMVATFADE